ncbi:xylitol dehydrogenase [Lachnospiraceae bacterium KM106-2]|nr:xylitol dehydrogenase [Lachnospiraceae bacterium KM106-2]
MLNTVYRLVAPRRIEVAFNDIDLFGDEVIVRPTYLSICHADQRYYQGTRAPEILAQKLPMALIHEAMGEVVFDPTGKFKEGQKVVMIPNTPFEDDPYIGANYLRSSKFRASGFDGFLQENVAIRPDLIVPLPDGINPQVAAFTEIVSVSVHAITRFLRFSHERRTKIGVWGDGNLGFITSLLLKKMSPESEVYVFGKDLEKLNYFSFADKVFTIDKIPEDLLLDHAFECVGGNGAQSAISQIIDYIKPEATIALLGVSEYPVPINTRMVLEKGLRLFGSSRSALADFEKTIELYTEYPDITKYLENLVHCTKTVRDIKDIYDAFAEDTKNPFGKTVMKWEK